VEPGININLSQRKWMRKKGVFSEYSEIMRFRRISELICRRSSRYLLAAFLIALTGCRKDDNNSNGYGTYSQGSGNVVQNGQTFFTSTTDISAVKVTGGTYNLTRSIVASGSNSSSPENSAKTGLNSVMLASSEDEVAIINSEGNLISSTGSGANGIFAFGKANINSKGDKLTHTGVRSQAIVSVGGSIIRVVNDTALTSGENSAAVSGGIITVKGGTYTTNGISSPAIYSSGSISCVDAQFTANGAEALIIEGSNVIDLDKCIVKCTYDKWGSLIFKNTAGDASATEGFLIMTGGSFTYLGKKGGMFYNTNSTANYSLKGVTLLNSCDTLIKCIKGSWGSSPAANGGITKFTGDSQTMSGLIHADAFSKVYITLKNYSVFTGALNNSNTGNLVSLTMDYSSKWILTGSSHINGLLTNPFISGSSVQNITGNGFNVYYNSGSNPSLGGLVYSLVNGGQLLPE